jgi:hypothetical protein
VLEVDLEKKQIALSMKPVQAARPPREHREPRRDNRPQGNRPQGNRPPGNRPQGMRPNRGASGTMQRDNRPKSPPKPKFTNNAFAVLAALKSADKESPKK